MKPRRLSTRFFHAKQIPMSNNAIASRAQAAIKAAQRPGTMAGLKTGEVEALLEPYKLSIQNALPNGSNPNRIIQAAVWQIVTNPALADCTYQSIIGCVLNASLLGVSAHLKQCFFIPYYNSKVGKNEAQFQLSYTGLLSLARRSGLVRDVFAEVVRKGDTFHVQYGTSKGIEHVPDLKGGSERTMEYAYAVIHYTHGGFEFVVMDRAEIEKRRLKSRGQKGEPIGVWKEWDAEMWKKTALRFLLKTAPLSEEQFAGLTTDEASITPAAFQRGELRAEMIAYSEEEGGAIMIEAPDLQKIREGVQDCNDLDALNAYWKQGAEEWKDRADVLEIFSQRRKEIEQ